MNGRRQLERLTKALRRGQIVPPDVSLWFLEGVRRRQEFGERFDIALGITDGREAKRLRDGFLRQAAKRMPGHWSGRERVRQVQRAAKILSTYADEVDWHNAPPWHEFVFMALREAPLPGRRRLFDLCNARVDCTNSARQ